LFNLVGMDGFNALFGIIEIYTKKALYYFSLMFRQKKLLLHKE